jgi:hypothetical protein
MEIEVKQVGSELQVRVRQTAGSAAISWHAEPLVSKLTTAISRLSDLTAAYEVTLGSVNYLRVVFTSPAAALAAIPAVNSEVGRLLSR